MSKQDGTQKTTLQRPTNDDKGAWNEYWKAKGQPWRWEPEIDRERQKYLVERRKIKPDIDQDIFPFKDIKLSRADVEWLLSTHDNNRGPIDWNDESQRERRGLDLRGADLRGVNLRVLPLAKCALVLAHLEGTDLHFAHLERAYLGAANLEKAYLILAHLGGAGLRGVHLEGAILNYTHFEGADLSAAFFDSVTNLENIVLSNDENDTAFLCDIHWGDVNVAVVDWSTISRFGDENKAKEVKSDGVYEIAARAYRQLSVVLRN